MSGQDRKLRVIYLAGAGRSGSTVLGQLLGRLPGAAYIGESWNLWEDAFLADDRCSCGRRYLDCQVWGPVLVKAGIDAAAGKALYATKEAEFDTLSLLRDEQRETPRLQDYREKLAAVYRAFADEVGATTLIDTSKTPHPLDLVAAMDGIELNVVHLVRDPRAVAYSWKHRAKLRRPDRAETETMAAISLFRSTARWLARSYYTERVIRRLGVSNLTLSYERFADNPQASLDVLTDRFGLPRADLATLAQPGDELHSVRGNPARFEHRQGIAIRRDDQWKARMPLAEKLLVTAIAVPMLGRMGYSLRA